MVRPERFELPTFWFVARRSIQLSYGRNLRNEARSRHASSLPQTCQKTSRETWEPEAPHAKINREKQFKIFQREYAIHRTPNNTLWSGAPGVKTLEAFSTARAHRFRKLVRPV